KQEDKPEDAGNDTRLSLPAGNLSLHAPPFGNLRRSRLHAPSFERAYLMPPTREICTRVLYESSDGLAVHGHEARSRLDSRREGRSGGPPRVRGEHQESNEGGGAVRASPWQEPRDDFRKGVDPDARVVRGRDDATRRPRPLPEPERSANRTGRDDRRHRESPEPLCGRHHVSGVPERERRRTRAECERAS